MDRTYRRGDLYYANLGQGVGSEQEGSRPVVIIQNNRGNYYSPTVIVAAITSRNRGRGYLPTHYPIGTETGLSRPSVVLLEQLRTVDKRRLDKYIGRLDEEHLHGLDDALAVSLSLTNHVSDPQQKSGGIQNGNELFRTDKGVHRQQCEIPGSRLL